MKITNGLSVPKSNYTKIPHEFINLLPDITSQAELKVLLYLFRHTWGFSEYGKPKKITVDEFMNGRMKKDRTRMDRGIGLTAESVRDGIDRAEKHGFILVEKDERDLGRIKKFYSLNIKPEEIVEDEVDNSAEDDEYLDSGKLDPTYGKLDLPAKKTRPRTEKETPERNLSNSAVADSSSLPEEKTALPSEKVLPDITGEAALTTKTLKPATKLKMSDLSLENQIAVGANKVQLDTEAQIRHKQMLDSARLIDTGCNGAGALALAFMETRGMVFTNGEVKRERKIAREFLLPRNVTPDMVREATASYMDISFKDGGKMVLTSLASIKSKAIELAIEAENSQQVEQPIRQANGFSPIGI